MFKRFDAIAFGSIFVKHVVYIAKCNEYKSTQIERTKPQYDLSNVHTVYGDGQLNLVLVAKVSTITTIQSDSSQLTLTLRRKNAPIKYKLTGFTISAGVLWSQSNNGEWPIDSEIREMDDDG